MKEKGLEPFSVDAGKNHELGDNIPEKPEEVLDQEEEYKKKIHEGLQLFVDHFEAL